MHCSWRRRRARCAAALLTLAGPAATGEDWLIFAALAAAAALAQRLIIPVGRHHGFPMAVVFLVAAALLLPPQLVAVMAHRAAPSGLRQPALPDVHHGVQYRELHVEHPRGLGSRRARPQRLGSKRTFAGRAAGVAAALVLVVVNHGILAAMLRLARGRSLRASGLLAPSSLLADFALAGLGVVLARFWLFNPYLIPLAIAPLVLIQRSFTLLARLGESEERFRTMFEGAPTGTVILDLDERVVSSNRAFEALLGLRKSDLDGPADRRAHRPPATGQPEPLRDVLSGTSAGLGGSCGCCARTGRTCGARWPPRSSSTRNAVRAS